MKLREANGEGRRAGIICAVGNVRGGIWLLLKRTPLVAVGLKES